MLLKIKTDKKVSATISIDESIATKIDLYAAYSKGSADDVVNQSLEYVFAADKDFVKFCTENTSAKAPMPLRVKRPAKLVAKPAKYTSPTLATSSAVR